MSHVTVARSSPEDNAIRYVLPVLCMTSCLHIIDRIGQNRRRYVMFRRVRQVEAPGGQSAVSDCIFKLGVLIDTAK